MSTILTDTDVAEKCDHIHRVGEWGVEIVEGQAQYIVKFWDCANCDTILSEPVERERFVHTHTEFVIGCFTCKAKTVQFNTGEANSNVERTGYTTKRWDGELQAYREARAQGIQPKTTKMKDVQAAIAQSDKTGKAFDASRK